MNIDFHVVFDKWDNRAQKIELGKETGFNKVDSFLVGLETEGLIDDRVNFINLVNRYPKIQFLTEFVDDFILSKSTTELDEMGEIVQDASRDSVLEYGWIAILKKLADLNEYYEITGSNDEIYGRFVIVHQSKVHLIEESPEL